MAYGLIHRLRVDSGIEAIVNVQANPGVTVTLIGSDKTTMFTAVADSATGLAAIAVNIPDTYTIGTDISADSFAEGNTPSIDISESKTYTAQFIKLNKGYTECGCTNAYKSNSLLVWWNGTKPTEYFSGWYCIDTDDNSETTGEGEVYQISSSISYRGFLKDVPSGTTKTYKVGAYITINGKNYYSASDTVTGTAKTISLSSFVKYTSSQTITVPEGCHSITAYCVGGGGGGAHNGHHWFAGNNSDTKISIGGGGGEGGAITTSTIDVIPGQSISIVIGGGGAGGNSWWKQVVSDYIDVYNGAGGSNGGTTTITVNGRSISANGGAGGGQVNVHDLGPTINGAGGGYGGSGRGNGGDGGRGFYAAGTRSGDNTAGSGSADYYQGSAGNGGAGAAFDGTWYGGGGGGGGSSCRREPSKGSTFYTYGLSGNGGNRGGGNGGYTSSTPTAGTANTGGGGGGGGSGNYYSSDSSRNGANGGSGVAILKFAA